MRCDSIVMVITDHCPSEGTTTNERADGQPGKEDDEEAVRSLYRQTDAGDRKLRKSPITVSKSRSSLSPFPLDNTAWRLALKRNVTTKKEEEHQKSINTGSRYPSTTCE